MPLTFEVHSHNSILFNLYGNVKGRYVVPFYTKEAI